MTVTEPPLVVSQLAAAALRQTGLWARILSIILLLGFLLMLAAAAGAIIYALAAARHSDVGPFLIIGISFFVIALFLFPAIILAWLTAARARRFATLRQPLMLDAALGSQKIFWLYTTIVAFLTLIGVAVAVAFFAAAIIADSHF